MILRYLIFLLFTLALCADGRPANALIHEHSPYLRMHAHNPVDWHPYGEEAFAKARREDKLIFLSIGFSTCHWCHVMEEESFENPEIAALLNRDYVAIKVDKEEMPQIDTYYQHLFSRLQHRRNGWPLDIIMTPDREILYMTTYIPPEDRYGVEGMRTLLPEYARIYRHDKVRLAKIVADNRAKIAASQEGAAQKAVADANLTHAYVVRMQRRFDKIYKGFDARPRFPTASNLRLLLDIYLLTGDREAWKMTTETLDAMARGGIYDQIEGGFFRYATDPDWVVPHYEKMLYTNAELLQIYTRAWLLTGKALYKKVVTETIAEYRRHLSEGGLYFGATDADSMGEEGGYYTYDYAEVKKRLQSAGFSKEAVEELMDYFDISEPGNFKANRSNVHFNTGFDTPPEGVEKVRKILADMRSGRTYPFVDKKIVTSWNAMMIKSLFMASVIDRSYLADARRSLDALLARNYRDGMLYHYTIGKEKPLHAAFLEDYAFLTDALITAYEYTYEARYLKEARRFADAAIVQFYDGKRWWINADTPRVATRYLDKYYTTPLPRMLHDLLSLAALTYDLKLYGRTRGMIDAERGRILAAFDRSPEALRLLIRMHYGDIVLKAKRSMLQRHRMRIARIRYPFLLTKPEESPLWLLCDMQTCFFSDTDLTKTIARIEKGR